MLPEITQKQFVKEVFNLFNILAVEKDRVVTLSLFEDIPKEAPVTLAINSLKETSFFGSFQTYGRSNIFKYQDNEAVERKDANTSFQVLDNTLIAEAIKIESAFSATDISAVPQMTTSLVVPNYELEYYFVTDNKMSTSSGSVNFSTLERNSIEGGDLISVGGDRRRVISMVSDFIGVVDVPFPNNSQDQDWYHWRYNKNDVALHIGKAIFNNTGLNVQDGGTEAGYTNYSKATFDPLRFENLKLNYYKLLVDSFERPFRVLAWCSFGVLKYLAINGKQPIYIESLDTYFYANKLEQWKFNGSCRVELIKINY